MAKRRKPVIAKNYSLAYCQPRGGSSNPLFGKSEAVPAGIGRATNLKYVARYIFKFVVIVAPQELKGSTLDYHNMIMGIIQLVSQILL